MNKHDAALLPIVKALASGPQTAKQVAVALGRSWRSVATSLGAMAKDLPGGRTPLVAREERKGGNLYSLTDAGRAKLAKAVAPP